MENRYSRSKKIFSAAEQKKLCAARVCVVGCGGIGGYVIEELARLGVGEIVAADPDCFDETNLNRQLLCTEENLGGSKALEAAERVRRVNSSIKVLPVAEALNEQNADKLLSGCNLAIDALDSIEARRTLAAACGRLGITLIHGAVNGWRAQVTVLPPCSDAFNYMYPAGSRNAKAVPSLSFTPALAASLEAAEAAKLLCGREAALCGRLLIIDLKTMEFDTVTL